MAQVVVMPQLGNTVESCLVTGWLVKVGDVVGVSTVLCEIETDKSSMEVPAGVSGTVLALLAAEGDDVPVKSPLVIVGEPGEDVSGLVDGTSGSITELGDEPTAAQRAVEGLASTDSADVGSTGSVSTNSASERLASPLSPRARGLAASRGIDTDQLTGTGPHGRVIERDVQAVIATGPGLTPGARALASGFVPGAAGSGIGGRVTRADLASASPIDAVETGEASTDFTSMGSGTDSSTDTPLKGVRKVIAERMMNSLATSAQVSYTATVSAVSLTALRSRLKASADPELAAITLGDLVGYAAVKALAKHPGLNAHLAGQTLRTFARVHLGMAVDTTRGLLVPTLRFADTLTLRQFSVRSKQLADEAIGGSINPDLLTGATFTLSNLGAFGVEAFTPLLNVPQVAILGVGAVFPRAAINPDGSVGAEQRIGFSLTADHRVIDGADAARYLKDLCALVADIDLAVLG